MPQALIRRSSSAPVNPLSWSGTQSLSGTQGVAYNLDLDTLCTHSGALSITYAVQSGALPAGVTLNGGTGVLSGTPTTVETANFVIRASEPGLFTLDRSFTFDVAAAGGGATPEDVLADWQYRSNHPAVIRARNLWPVVNANGDPITQGFGSYQSSNGSTFPQRDLTRYVSGGESLRLLMPGNGTTLPGGEVWQQFSDDNSVYAGANQQVCVQFRFRPDALFLSQNLGVAWKWSNLTEGPKPGFPAFSCESLETVQQADTRGGNGAGADFPNIYHSCGRFTFIGDYNDGTRIRMQTERESPFCAYPNDPENGCFLFTADTWHTSMIVVDIGALTTVQPGTWPGSRFGTFDTCYYPSRIRQYIGLEGGALVLVNDSNREFPNGVPLFRGSNQPNPEFGTVWLTTYGTGGYNTGLTACGVNYDELIITGGPRVPPGRSHIVPNPSPSTVSRFGETCAGMMADSFLNYTPLGRAFIEADTRWGAQGIGAYCNRGVYDYNNRSFEWWGGPHDSAFAARHLRFRESTDIANVANDASNNDPYNRNIGPAIHGYNHLALDPYTSDLYHTRVNSSQTYRLSGSGYPTATGWVSLTAGNGSDTSLASAFSIEWFPDRDSLIVITHVNGVWEFRPRTTSQGAAGWTQLFGPQAGMSYHSWSAYSQKERAIYFGGGDGGGNAAVVMYRLSSTGVLTTRANTPQAVATQSGASSRVIVPDLSSNAAALILYGADGQFYRYTQSSNTWSAALGAHGFTGEYLVTPCPAYGVNLCLNNPHSTTPSLRIHKP
jgi:Putative Ig domain